MEDLIGQLLQSLGQSLLIGSVLSFVAGVITSLSPCIISLIPVVVAYVGAWGSNSRAVNFRLSALFVIGLGLTFTALGGVASYVGGVFGQVGTSWYYLIAILSLVMGLHLLEVIQVPLPGLKTVPRLGGPFGALGMGLMFGLVASPCSTPILAVILALVAAKGQLYYGAVMMFFFGLGHGLPLLLAGTFTGFLRTLSGFKKYSGMVTRLSGYLLLALGLYFFTLVWW